MILKLQGGTENRPPLQKRAGLQRPGHERAVHVFRFQYFYTDSDQAVAEVTVRRDLIGRLASHFGRSRQVNGVGDECGGNIGCRGAAGESGDTVGNAEREAAPAPARGGDAAYTICAADAYGACGTGDGECLTFCKMQRNVSTIVDIGAGERCGCAHFRQHVIRDSACHGGHGRDARSPMRLHGVAHAAGDGTREGQTLLWNFRAQQWQLCHQLIEYGCKAKRHGGIGFAHSPGRTMRLDHEINWPVVEMQSPSVRQHAGLHRHYGCSLDQA